MGVVYIITIRSTLMNKEYQSLYDLIAKYEMLLTKRLGGKKIKMKDKNTGSWVTIPKVNSVTIRKAMGGFKITVKSDTVIAELDDNAEIKYV